MLVDAHTHYLPQQYLDELADLGGPVGVEAREDGAVLHHGHGSIPLFPGFTDVDERVRWMAEHGIDRTVVSVSTPNPYEGPFSAEETTRLVRAINEGNARLRDEHPEVFVPLGMLPLRQPEAAVAELDRIDDLELAGVALPTAVGDRKLSHPDLEPVFDRLDRLGLPAFVHPRPNEVSEALPAEEWHVNTLAVFPSETTIQLCRLLMDGFFDRYDIDLLVAHLGGALPYLAGRLERGRRAFSGEGEPPDRPVVEYLREFHYDVISFHPPAIRAAVETVGVDRLLFGTDYPFGIEDADWTIESVETAIPDGDDREAVFGGNAVDLFGL